MEEKLLFIANWKSHKTIPEAISWLEFFSQNKDKINFDNKEIIVLPPFTAISSCFEYIKTNNLMIHLGAQNISCFDEGAYTGEISAKQLKDLVEYTLIGHSERKTNCRENDEDIKNKVEMAKNENLTTIVCIQNENTPIPEKSDFIAYEPIFAIGTGNPDTPQNIKNIFNNISQKSNKNKLIYGGSINQDNIKSFTGIPDLSGFLIGTASLNPNDFIELVSKC